MLGALLGTTVPVATFGTAAAIVEPQGKSKSNGRGGRRGKQKRKGNSRARAQARTKAGNHCISPAGRDLNEFYGISAQIVAPPPERGFLGCNEVGAGEQWVIARAWFMAHSFDEVPTGFVPAGATPLEDFVAKFLGLRYVIDPGTEHEQSVFIPNSDDLFIGEDGGLVVVNPGTLGTVHPLSIGAHTVDLYWVFRAMHCDGIAAILEENCLPEGETLFGPPVPLAFAVTPGHN